MMVNVILSNQRLSIRDLDRVLAKCTGPKLVCSTHLLSERERSSLSEAARIGTIFRTQEEYFTDLELSEIDTRALQAAQKMQPISGIGGFDQFKAAMLDFKSMLLFEKISVEFKNVKIYVVDGLGWSARWWIRHGATEIKIRVKADWLSKLKFQLSQYFRFRWINPGFFEANKDQYTLVFLSSLSRVSRKFSINFTPTPIWKQLLIVGSRYKLFPYSSSCIAVCTLHDLRRLNRPCLILQDGHLPSNYSSGYMWEYDRKYLFVPSNPFSERWLISSGVKILKIKEFGDSIMEPVVYLGLTTNRILFVMGHSGDWSSLISRSDTCKLAFAIKAIAEKNLNLFIKVRFHPTMVHPDHDGVNSYSRLCEEIVSWGLNNVSVSRDEMLEDLASADIIISEYSQVLIDGWSIGKLGIICNLTGRRSFMSDYEQLGFLNTKSIDDLNKILSLSPFHLAMQQNKAVARYNSLITSWREGE
jgi:hypothetical protein